MTDDILRQLAPTGVLRAGINLSNFLLVTGRSPTGAPEGVSPDMAAAVAERLGVKVDYVPFDRPDALAEAAGQGVWDIALIGAEPARAQKIAFTDAYAEIESTYLVRLGAPYQSVADVDRAGVRISVSGGSAYDLWLERNIRHATLVRAAGIEESFVRFIEDDLDVLAGLRPRLLTDAERMPGALVLPDCFTSVQQAIGTARENTAGAAFLQSFVTEVRSSRLVERFIARHGVRGLTAAG